MTALDEIARAAISQDGIESAAIFVTAPGVGSTPAPESDPGAELRLAAAAGITGPPLDGLVAAVRDRRHPIRHSLSDADPTWDVQPMNPGGPALRSHLPVRPREASGETSAIGVLALAHEAPLARAARERLEALAAAAAAAASTTPARET